MERSFFQRSRDASPLLSQHESHKLIELPPRPYSDSATSRGTSRSSRPSGSPRPSTPSRNSQSSRVQFSIPPPITQSVLFHTPTSSPSQSSHHEHHSSGTRSTHISTPNPKSPLTILSRRERAIQTELQNLLDAQSAGLIQGRLGNTDDLSSDGGSITPTSHSTVLYDAANEFCSSPYGGRGPTGGVVPVRQPKAKKISLRGARRGILNKIYEFEDVKLEEMSIMEKDIKTLNTALSQVTHWEAQLAAFESQMRTISDGAEGREISDLRNERSVLATEIRELEDRLLNLKAKERHLGERIEELDNKKEARESSFRNGRQELETEVKRFLFRPPVQDVVLANLVTATSNESPEEEDIQAFLTLPPKRRTLEMARDWLSSSITTLERRKSAAQTETTALRAGAQMWEDTVSLVIGFENELKLQMSEGKFDLKKQLDKMGVVLKELEGKALTAGKEGWNLLICAVGAELEAFREGEGILRDALGTADEGSKGGGKEEELLPLEDVSIGGNEPSDNGHGLNEINDGEKGNGVLAKGKEPEEYRSESEDDGPDPAFFMSKDNDEDAA